MLKALGLVFLCLLGATGVTLLGNYFGDGFAVNYAREHSVEVLASTFALNVATATFLIGGLLNIEERVGKDVFDGPRREISHNLKAMAILFVINLALVAFVKEKSGTHIPGTQILVDDVFATLVLAILLFYIYLLMEIVTAAFKLRSPK